MTRGLIILLALTMSACATARTKYSDPVLRIMLDPDSIEVSHHARIQQALVASGKWTVVDRAAAFSALKKEQERIHQVEPERYNNREKWARMSQLYGVGGVVTANAQCARRGTLFLGRSYQHCLQTLSIVDASTGEVIASVEAESDGEPSDDGIAPSWALAVELLNAAFPAHFESRTEHKRLTEYRDLTEAEALAIRKPAAKPQPAAEDGEE